MTIEGFEPAVPAFEQLQTYALDRRATGIGTNRSLVCHYYSHAHIQAAGRKEGTASGTHGGVRSAVRITVGDIVTETILNKRWKQFVLMRQGNGVDCRNLAHDRYSGGL
jgi:O-acetylhomoserine/O-acetylserine sulfhydrylase-like pyridoxal-dependent enzyme